MLNTNETTHSPDELARRAVLRERMLAGQQKMREMREAGWKPVRLNPVEAAQAKPNSLKLAIKAHCWMCVGADADPGAKFRVRDCAVGDKCSLFPHRPWQTVKGGIRYDEAGELMDDQGHDEDEDAE